MVDREVDDRSKTRSDKSRSAEASDHKHSNDHRHRLHEATAVVMPIKTTTRERFTQCLQKIIPTQARQHKLQYKIYVRQELKMRMSIARNTCSTSCSQRR